MTEFCAHFIWTYSVSIFNSISIFVIFNYQHKIKKDEHAEEYWNNIEEDGESRSDCASSVGGGNEDKGADQTSQRGGDMTTSLDPTPEVPAKKKRPPRKRKKKKQQNQESGQNAKQEDESKSDEANKKLNEVENIPAVNAENHSSSKVEKTVPSSAAPKEEVQSVLPNTTKPAQTKPVVTSSWVTAEKTKISAALPNKSKRETTKSEESANQWQVQKSSSKNTKPSGTVGQRPLSSHQSAARIAASHSSKPGATWGTRNLQSTNSQQPVQSNHGKALGTSKASDWRSHTLTRNVSSSTRSIGPSSRSIGGGPSMSKSSGWPSLGETPNLQTDNAKSWPTLGSTPGKNSKKPSPQSAIQGPWGTKKAPTQSAWGKSGK